MGLRITTWNGKLHTSARACVYHPVTDIPRSEWYQVCDELGSWTTLKKRPKSCPHAQFSRNPFGYAPWNQKRTYQAR